MGFAGQCVRRVMGQWVDVTAAHGKQDHVGFRHRGPELWSRAEALDESRHGGGRCLGGHDLVVHADAAATVLRLGSGKLVDVAEAVCASLPAG